jgi:hypothetical protein
LNTTPLRSSSGREDNRVPLHHRIKELGANDFDYFFALALVPAGFTSMLVAVMLYITVTLSPTFGSALTLVEASRTCWKVGWYSRGTGYCLLQLQPLQQ